MASSSLDRHSSSTQPTSTRSTSRLALGDASGPRRRTLPGSFDSEDRSMERVGFTMRLLPGREAEYRRRHAAVWPEMLDALRAAGARDYSIFIHGDQLFAYLEVDDFAVFRSTMAATPVNDRWQAEMTSLIDPMIYTASGFH